MLTLTRGNILDAGTEALVNTVNTVGVMGKGIALQFKRAFPENYEAYRRACDRGELAPGRLLVYETGWLNPPKYIINFPTKTHWRSRSRLEDIEAGLRTMAVEIQRLGLRSVAIPPLGCGNGGLSWHEVRPRIEAALARLDDVDVRLYEPGGAPHPRQMMDRRKRPRLTPARASFIELLARYGELGFSRTLLEAQKLAYFLQEAGQPLKLRYQRAKFGPYAHNLDKALQDLEGHFLVGLGDGARADAEIDLLPGAVEEARKTLSSQPDTRGRFDRVASVIEGFESPYGLELLASVHWVARKEEPRALDPVAATDAIRSWTARKAHLFQSRHVQLAWDRLADQGWLDSGPSPSSLGEV
jgi:O-acetyl-ADP-ribose deacetylase (regulator of RNase III)